jgi:2-oxoglutarate dehydrogenase E1 component
MRRRPGACASLKDSSMSRQDANAAFAHTSFLYGGNAAYIEDLHARYAENPNSVDA